MTPTLPPFAERSGSLRVLLLILAMGVMVPAALAQTIERHDENQAGLAWAWADAPSVGTEVPSGAWLLYAQLPLDDGSLVDLVLPLAFVSGELSDGSTMVSGSNSSLGNARLRFTSTVLDEAAQLDFSGTLPLSSSSEPEAGDAIGLDADLEALRAVLVHAAELFTPDVAAITAGLESTFDFADKRFAVRPRLEGSFWISTGEALADDFEFFVRPSIGLLARVTPVTLLAEFRARTWVTSDTVIDFDGDSLPFERDLDFGESTIQDLRLAIEADLGRFRPAVAVAFSLDEALDRVAERVVELRVTGTLR